MSAPAPPVIFTGAVDLTRKKDDLQAMCTALGLSIKGDTGRLLHKDALLVLVESRLFSSNVDTLENNPTFAQLYEYRKKKDTKMPGKGAKGKTSAAKTAQDEAEQSKPSQHLTPAALKLLEQKATVDPRASFTPLPIPKIPDGEKKVESKERRASFSSSLSRATKSAKSDKSASGDDDDGEQEQQEDANRFHKANKTVKGPILVKFSNPQEGATETFVHNIGYTEYITPGGTVNREADLRTLIPAAINNLSPIKDNKRARISRPGFSGEGSKLPIARVSDLIDGPTPDTLSYERMYTLRLRQSDQNNMVADLFYELPEKRDTADGSEAPAVQPATSLTGSGADRPLEIAQQRHGVAAAPPLKEAQDTAQFRKLLLAIVKSGTLTKRTNSTASDAVKNFNEFNPFFLRFVDGGELTKKGAGYLIPPDYRPTDEVAAAVPNWADHLNTSFKKEHIILAAGLRKSSTNEVHSFVGRGLKLKTELGDYLRQGCRGIDSDEVRDLEEQYDDIAYGAFKTMVEDELKEHSNAKPGTSKGRKGSKKTAAPKPPKRARSASVGHATDEDEDKEEPRQSEKSRGKKRAKGEKKSKGSKDIDKDLEHLEKQIKALKASKAKADGYGTDEVVDDMSDE
ncbi:hypothetical protein DFH06DRAFT_1313966 [Mycena polygramma]|nr:hypothetical protein DFH06DRAFT_1313966 [Mycena polygramma]